MACENPLYINSANVDSFGYGVTFNPYLKTITISIDGFTSFKSGGEANITSIAFTVTNENNDTYTGSINPSIGGESVTISNVQGGQLFFGQYTIVGVLTEANASTYSVQTITNVCFDARMNNANYINGSSALNVEVDCGRAVMIIKEGNAFKYHGLTPSSYVYSGSVTYPNNYQEQVNFTAVPYQLSLIDSITGMYQVSLLTTAYYDLGCNSTLAIQYRSQVNKDIQCGAGMCDLTCCWQEALDIQERGGTQGSLMAEKLIEANPYYVEAFLLWSCGKNNDKAVAKVREILNCDCKCSQNVLIQANPISYGTANLNGECGTTITTDENGDILVHSYAYTIAKGDSGDMAFSLNTTQVGNCTKRTTITFDYDVLQQNILTAISSSQTFINNWKDVLGITDCPCDEVTTLSVPQLLEVLKQTSDYYTLADTNFVKNDVVIGAKYEDGTQITGGTFGYTEIVDQVIQQQGLITTQGQEITLPCSVCGESLVGQSGKLITYVNSNCGCREPHECDIEIQSVDYSERYTEAYRFNPQIEDAPYIVSTEVIDGQTYTITKLIYADSFVTGSNASGSMIRYIMFKTDSVGTTTFHETRTLFGDVKVGGGSLTTYNNTAGDIVLINKASSINLDHSEVVNGYPVMYFVTFGGAICRAVRTGSSNCDERKNWTIYLLKDLQSPTKRLYGMKKWYVDSNGNQTFLYLGATDSKVYLLTYNGVGGKNIGANWTITDLNIPLASINGNINVDLREDYIFLLGTNFIKIAIYSGTNTLANLQNTANYSVVTCCDTASLTAISYSDGVGGSSATIDNPNWIQKINVNSEDRYYFGNSSTNNGNNYQNWSYLRYFAFRGEDPSVPDSWVFDTEIVVNVAGDTPYTDGTWVADTSSAVNALSQGMCEIEDYGMVSLGLFGVRKFDMVSKEVDVVSGQSVAGGSLDITNPQMDTQFKYVVSCNESN
jgi:hypothetical protein